MPGTGARPQRTKLLVPTTGWFVVLLQIVVLATTAAPDDRSRRPLRRLDVRDSIEATRVVHEYADNGVLISPDGTKYLVVLHRGDVARNGSWIELLVGSTQSLAAASKGSIVARLFSKSTAQVNDLIKGIRWLGDNQRVTFLWNDGRRSPGIVEFNLNTHRMRTLVRHRMPIAQYDVSKDGNTIVFSAQPAPDNEKISRLKHNGFAVTDQTIWALLEGNLDGWLPGDECETFVVLNSRERHGQISKIGKDWRIKPELLHISPDGRYAIAVGPVHQIPVAWDRYTEHILKDIYLPQARQNSGKPNWVRQYFLIDVRRLTMRPLWDVPENPRGKIAWSTNSRNVIIGPTFLPVVDADASGLAGVATAEVNIETGRYAQIPVPISPSGFGYRPLSWRSDGTVELADVKPVTGQPDRLDVRKVNQAWQANEIGTRSFPLHPAVQIEIQEDPNNPPVLYAIDSSTGRKRLIRELNPQLKKYTLASVKVVHWKATDGKPWTGLLYYPVGYQAGQRYPLVIQTHGYSVKEFSLEGSFTTVFAAQPLANHGIAVLQVGGPDEGDKNIMATPGEAPTYMAGFEGAIEQFVASGLADQQKVGIIGFSRTGWIVEYMLTHSQVPIAAAEVADNIDGSYVQYILAGNEMRPFYEGDKGQAPAGDGLEAWFRTSPGFNADKIQTPLRIELDSGPVSSILSEWEMFSNLQYLNKPVELFVIPDIEHGVHILQNPAQRLASQGGTVDWFCFWLKNEKHSDVGKASQYTRWQTLRELQLRNEVATAQKSSTSHIDSASLDERHPPSTR